VSVLVDYFGALGVINDKAGLPVDTYLDLPFWKGRLDKLTAEQKAGIKAEGVVVFDQWHRGGASRN
jgi:ribose transport system substrate-binding protein